MSSESGYEALKQALLPFGQVHTDRVLSAIPPGVEAGTVSVTKIGLAYFRSGQAKSLVVIGCPTCLGASRSQDSMGYPTIDGKALICYADLEGVPVHVPGEIAANTWLCPDCRMPIPLMLPRWDAK